MKIFKTVDKGMVTMVGCRIRNAMDLVKLIAMGADIICIDVLVIDFIKAYLRTKVTLNSNEDIDLDHYNEKMDWAEIGELFSELLNLLIADIKDILADLNILSTGDLTRDNLVTTDYNTASITGITLAGFGDPVPFWRHRSE